MSSLSYEFWRENLDELVNSSSLQISCEIKNDNMFNVIEEVKNYIADEQVLTEFISVKSIGYSQNEWQEYNIRYNKEASKNDIDYLIQELKKSFTHKNDYFVSKKEVIEIHGKSFESESFDYVWFAINDIEFPEPEDVKERYNSIYGIDYDIIELKID